MKYNGSHIAKETASSNTAVRAHSKALVSVLALVLAIIAGIGTTTAYLTVKSNDAVNTFQYAAVTCAVSENFDGSTKSDVKIQNTGNIPAFIRCTVLVTWKDANGNVYSKTPIQGTDYSLSLGSGWLQGSDGYYYWSDPVWPQEFTGVLIGACTKIANAPAGFTLSVEILADAIQSEPANAVSEAWGVTVSEGQVLVK